MCNDHSATVPGDLGLTDLNHACACGHASASEQPGSNGAIREHYLVEGMTCSHCVSSVTEEVSAIDGVESVSVDLAVGGQSRVMVVSSRPIAADDVRAAVTEAGYSLV